jgi:cysteine desulfuration protein SufE
MNMGIEAIQDEVIEEFSFFTDWMEKYEHIITYGKSLDAMDSSLKTEDNLVRGCQSQVWLHAEMRDGLLWFTADSDAIITKGLVGLMVRVLSGHKPEEIAHADLRFVDELGLKEHLSPNRANGLVSMIKKMKMYALAYQAKSTQ